MNKEVCKKYRFNDFTLENYERLLVLAKKNYAFVQFGFDLSSEVKQIILRHDIEFSIPIALKMAKMEFNLGIKATYLLQIHADFYNALERKSIDMIKQIIGLGHTVGLHFDSHYWNCTKEDELERCMLIDKHTLEQYLEIGIDVFSFHNTNDFILSCNKSHYAGMLNIYSEYFKKNVGYCADSTGFWRYEILKERLELAKDTTLQILIHDGMWSEEVLPPRRRIYQLIDEHANFMKNSYDQTLIDFGAKNIDWQGEV